MTKAPCDVSGKNIYYLSFLKGHPTLRIWQQGFLDQAHALGYKNVTIASNDDSDWAKTVALGEQILATETKGNYAMVFAFLDPAEKALIAKFAAAGVPVVVGHVQVVKADYPGVVAWAGFSSEKWGRAAANSIGAKIGGTGTVAVTEGSFNQQEDAVAAAFTDEMNKKFPNVKVLKPLEEGFDTPAAIAKAVSILQANPDVVAALSTTGAGLSAWSGAADQTGRTVFSIGPDATRPNLDAVRDGKAYGIAAQPGYEEHQAAVDLATQALCGQTPTYANELAAPIIYAADLAPYYVVVDKVDARK
jgi:ABC-type sugar transport system substrate-binding protein